MFKMFYFEDSYMGQAGYVSAETAGMARHMVVTSAKDAGYPISYKHISIRRDSNYDHLATSEGYKTIEVLNDNKE